MHIEKAGDEQVEPGFEAEPRHQGQGAETVFQAYPGIQTDKREKGPSGEIIAFEQDLVIVGVGEAHMPSESDPEEELVGFFSKDRLMFLPEKGDLGTPAPEAQDRFKGNFIVHEFPEIDPGALSSPESNRFLVILCLCCQGEQGDQEAKQMFHSALTNCR